MAAAEATSPTGDEEWAFDEQSKLVFECYGRAMFNVQTFEQTLASVALALEITSEPERSYPSENAYLRAMKRRVGRLRHAYQKASASGLYKMLPEGFDQDLKAEIEALLPRRDDLAHRYLTARRATRDSQRPEGIFKRGTFRQLAAIGEAFDVVAGKLVDRMEALVETAPKREDLPDSVQESWAQLWPTLVYGNRLAGGDDATPGGRSRQRG